MVPIRMVAWGTLRGTLRRTLLESKTLVSWSSRVSRALCGDFSLAGALRAIGTRPLELFEPMRRKLALLALLALLRTLLWALLVLLAVLWALLLLLLLLGPLKLLVPELFLLKLLELLLCKLRLLGILFRLFLTIRRTVTSLKATQQRTRRQSTLLGPFAHQRHEKVVVGIAVGTLFALKRLRMRRGRSLAGPQGMRGRQGLRWALRWALRRALRWSLGLILLAWKALGVPEAWGTRKKPRERRLLVFCSGWQWLRRLWLRGLWLRRLWRLLGS